MSNPSQSRISIWTCSSSANFSAKRGRITAFCPAAAYVNATARGWLTVEQNAAINLPMQLRKGAELQKRVTLVKESRGEVWDKEATCIWDVLFALSQLNNSGRGQLECNQKIFSTHMICNWASLTTFLLFLLFACICSLSVWLTNNVVKWLDVEHVC